MRKIPILARRCLAFPFIAALRVVPLSSKKFQPASDLLLSTVPPSTSQSHRIRHGFAVRSCQPVSPPMPGSDNFA